MDTDFIKKYLSEVKRCVDEIMVEKIQNVVDILYKAYLDKRQVFIMGNGGSASTASHFACDLGKNVAAQGKERFRVMSLNDNIAHFSAIANDFGYENVFVEQLKNLLNEDDVVILITASGNSPNILKAVDYANEVGAHSIGFIGFGGGKLAARVKDTIVLSDKNYALVEDIHMVLCHMISSTLKEKISKGHQIHKQ